MAKFKTVDEAIEGVNVATSALATRLDAIVTELQDAGTDAERQAAVDKLNAISATLEAMGQDPNNPIPTP